MTELTVNSPAGQTTDYVEVQSNGVNVFEVTPSNANPQVNGVQLVSGSAGLRPTLQTIGSDPDVGLLVKMKGVGAIQFQGATGSVFISSAGNIVAAELQVLNTISAAAVSAVINGFGAEQTASLLILNQMIGMVSLYDFKTVPNAINGVMFQAAIAGVAPSITAGGSFSDTDIPLSLKSNGAANVQVDHGSLAVTTPGQGVAVKAGANCRLMKGLQLVNGTLTIANTSVTANTCPFVQNATSNANVGALSAVATPGQVVVQSTDSLDNSTFNLLLIEAI